MKYTYRDFILFLSDWMIITGTRLGARYRTETELKAFIQLAETMKAACDETQD